MGRFEFDPEPGPDPELWPEELSGIAWTGADDYVAVGDAHAVVHRLAIHIDPASGAVQRASFGAPVPLADERGAPLPEPARRKDREGIAYDPETRSVWIANEWTDGDSRRSSLARHALATGATTAMVRTENDPMLRVFDHARPNRGFEALGRSEDGASFWTGNEEPLSIDAPGSAAGGFVRLQRFDGAMRPAAQVAYRVDPVAFRITQPALLAGRDVSGVVDLVPLSGSRLLVLERAFAGDSTGSPGLRSRIYLVDTAGATDVSRGDLASGLGGRAFVPAAKTLLWEQSWGLTNSNFEGMTLGPRLRNGDRSLLLIADNNGGTLQALFALRLSGM